MKKDTFIALATTKQVSALAVIRVNGPLCVNLIEQQFHQKNPQPRYQYLHTWRDSDGHVIDQIVYSYWRAPASYTGEDLLEIVCHGNLLIVEKILRQLIHNGCRMAEPGEFTRTAFLNNKLDLQQAESVLDLIEAKNEIVLSLAQKNLGGFLSQQLKAFQQSLVDVLANLEMLIEFSEEHAEFIDLLSVQRSLDELQARLNRFLIQGAYGKVLREGLSVLILGAPNAGKSCLLNFLLGEDRALVSDIAGTTRDVVSEHFRLGYFSLKLLDTAGLRFSEDPLEKLGIQKTIEQCQKADLFLWVIDASESPPHLLPEVIDKLKPEQTLLILNKTDLGILEAYQSFLPEYSRKAISLLKNEGLEDFHSFLETWVSKKTIVSPGEALLLSAWLTEMLKKSAQMIEKAKNDFAFGRSLMGLQELKQIVNLFQEITGKVENEAILDRVFENFCIGK